MALFCWAAGMIELNYDATPIGENWHMGILGVPLGPNTAITVCFVCDFVLRGGGHNYGLAPLAPKRPKVYVFVVLVFGRQETPHK